MFLYSSASFLNAANSYLDGSSTSSEVIKEIQKVSENQFEYYAKASSLDEKFRHYQKEYLIDNGKLFHKDFRKDFFHTFKESESAGLREIDLTSASIDELRITYKIAMNKVEEINKKMVDEKNDELTRDYLKVRYNNWLDWLLDISFELASRD